MSRTNKKSASGGSKQSNKPKPNKQDEQNEQKDQANKQNNKANQAQEVTVDQDSGDVTIWIEGNGVTIGSINTGNAANATASQPAKQ